MKHTLDELLGIVYRYYPRGVGIVDGDLDVQAIHDSEEHARLVAARLQAANDERWRALQHRIAERFPEASLTDPSLHLSTGNCDACYPFTISLPGAATDRALSFQVSFLAPYYTLHREATAHILKEPRTDLFLVTFQGMSLNITRSPFDRDLIASLDDESLKPVTFERRYRTFELLPEQRPYAEWIAREIETTFGCEFMPPEIGAMLVPELSTPKLPGQVRIFDCLFSSDEWVKPSPSDVQAPSLSVDARSLTEPFAAMLTVSMAISKLVLTLMVEAQLHQGKGFAISCVGDTDGVLHKENLLKSFAMARLILEPLVTPRGVSAMREFEEATGEFQALIEAWDGQGAPPAAVVACASSVLGRCPDLDKLRARSS
jgi:hypothetical protein